jgi:hypothetical protein
MLSRPGAGMGIWNDHERLRCERKSDDDCSPLKKRPITGLNRPRGWVEVQLYSFVTSALEGCGWSASRLGRFTPGKDSVPIVQKAGLASGPVWTCTKISSPPGFDPRTFQPVPSRVHHLLSFISEAKSECICTPSPTIRLYIVDSEDFTFLRLL